MTETLLALIPDYGLPIIFGSVFVACFGLPFPSSLLVLTAGGFAAAGDLSLGSVFMAAAAAYIIGDQLVYALARWIGPSVLGIFERSELTAPVVEKSKSLLQKRGSVAVLISHTILSPTGPYVSYLSGAGGLAWRSFTVAAVPGAFIWAAGYVGLGYTFASQLEQVAQILSNFLVVILAGAVAVASVILLKRRWDTHKSASDQKTTS